MKNCVLFHRSPTKNQKNCPLLIDTNCRMMNWKISKICRISSIHSTLLDVAYVQTKKFRHFRTFIHVLLHRMRSCQQHKVFTLVLPAVWHILVCSPHMLRPTCTVSFLHYFILFLFFAVNRFKRF
ncbi:unnamed protein product [Onchocerca flexuosa]|uniref:Ovule protein n=1 Tax=Onchocerca flexuosa TaxID=387005 RepID=A0A183HPK5_9BILA|nr:unnamed protein product [Onchocerca flexuosa]